jgi:TRAP-type C4-dicarboxylate transport system permease small subunit
MEIIRGARVISLIGLVGLLVLAGITVGEVLLRWLFKYPIPGVYDLSQLVVIIVIASCLPLVCAERNHITVRLLGTILGKRANELLEAFGALITMIIFGLMAWQLWIYANELAASNQTTWLILLPVSPWWRVATILIALCFPIQMVTFYLSLKAVFRSRNDQATESDLKSQDIKKDGH